MKISNSLYNPDDPNDHFVIESIDFTENWYRNAGGKRYGSISVMKQKGIETLDDYVKYVDKEKEIYAKGVAVTLPRPKIKYSVIGEEVAITIYPQGNSGPAEQFDDRYIVVKEGLIYLIQASQSERFRDNQEENTKNFTEIVNSIEFIN